MIIATIGKNQQAVQGIPIGRLANLESRVSRLESNPSSGGYTVETPSGSLYNQSTGTGGITFTVTATPVYIVSDGATYFEGFGYSLSGLTVTMTNPVTQFIRSFYS